MRFRPKNLSFGDAEDHKRAFFQSALAAVTANRVPNAFGAESFDWVDPLITHPVRMEDGYGFPTERPGWGFEFKPAGLVEI